MEGVSVEWDDEQPEAAIHGVLDVDDVTLPKLADGRQKLLLLFYAAWDRFSKEMVPIYKDVAASLATHTDVLLAKVDGDRYWKLSSRYDAASYPHLVYFDQENKLGISYEGERTAEAIVSYVLHGERRGPRLPALQAAVQAFRAGSSGEQREAAIAQAEALVAGMSAADKDVGQLYIKAMKAAVAFGEDFLSKEARRLESSLEGGGLPPSTYTKFRQQIDIAKDPTAAVPCPCDLRPCDARASRPRDGYTGQRSRDLFQTSSPIACRGLAMVKVSDALHARLFIAICVLCSTIGASSGQWVGVSLGLDASSQPIDPARAVSLIKARGFSAVKLFRPDGPTFTALAGSGLEVVTAVPNDRLAEFAAGSAAALAWVDANIMPYADKCNITGISVGNEVMGQREGANDALPSLVPAMESLYSALQARKLHGRVKVTSPQDMTFLAASFPPSASDVHPSIRDEMAKLLAFLNRTGSHAVLNCYPFFAYQSAPQQISRDLVFFKGATSGGYSDGALFYASMLDAMIDAAITAFEKLGFPNIPVAVGEVGWPSAGSPVASLSDAAEFNGALIDHLTSGQGTPKRPGMPIRAYIFEMFDEDRKDAGPGAFEQAWGVNYANGSEKYPLNLKPGGGVSKSPPPSPTPSPTPSPPPSPAPSPSPTPSPAPPSLSPPPPSTSPQTPPPDSFVPAPSCDTAAESAWNAMTWACGEGHVECGDLLSGTGSGCWAGQNSSVQVAVQASVAMNRYFQAAGQGEGTCVFGNSGAVVSAVPAALAGCGLESGNGKWCVAACLQ
ncbi:unnamed protein product [Closterium sp. Yama58-4]|nr:unnamed protein product [Closterium sp. Yama58-4]